MELSAEEARRAYHYLQEKGPAAVGFTTSTDVPADVIERARNRIASSPDPRPDRVAYAAGVLNGHLPSARDVAERMVWRIVADSVR